MQATSTAIQRMTLPSDQDASGRTLGDEEIAALSEAIRSGVLTSTKGTFVKRFETAFAERLGVPHAHACASGTAAIHCAIAALNPSPGDEIITTPITDMGALAPIIYQGAIPVFADVEPETCNLSPESVAQCISPRTKAIVVTHLFGNPCRMNEIMEIARRHKIPVIEDAAQAFESEYDGMPIGTIGDIGCFSLQQGKHITCGEGGIVVTRDAALARRMYLFINKAWGYGDPQPDHYFLALNYRMSELAGAVCWAQLPKLAGVAQSRIERADQLTAAISDLPGIAPPTSPPGAVHTYWKYCVRVDSASVPGGAVALAARLRDYGIASAPRYIQKPAFRCEVFARHVTLGDSRWPFNLARPEAVDYSQERFPGAFSALEQVLVLPWNERYTSEHVEYIAACLHECVKSLRKDLV
jgi:dTDP-4-amino-4,6-dideoxygalactose transaminase